MLPHGWWPNIHNAVLEEFNHSLQYAEKTAQTFSLNVRIYYETGFIVRKQTDPTVITLKKMVQ